MQEARVTMWGAIVRGSLPPLFSFSASFLSRNAPQPASMQAPSRCGTWPWTASRRSASHRPKNDQQQLQVLVEPLGGPSEGISVLSLNRPEARNAIGRQMLRELEEAIGFLERERTTRCMILRSLVPGEGAQPVCLFSVSRMALNCCEAETPLRYASNFSAVLLLLALLANNNEKAEILSLFTSLIKTCMLCT